MAVDDNNKPLPIPALLATTPMELKRYAAAEIRRQARLATRESLQQYKAEA